MVNGRVDDWAKWKFGGLTLGKLVLGELTIGRVDNWAKRPMGKMAMGQNGDWAK